jgi:hypothetical protein
MAAPTCINRRSLHEPTLGFTIFRTVYTPESDIQFPLFLAKLNAYFNHSIDKDLRPSPFMNPSTEPSFNSGPNEEIRMRFANDIVEDRDLDGESTDDIRDAFTKWLDPRRIDLECHQLYARYRVCIMVDEAVLNSVAAAPEDPSEDHELEDAWVKVVGYLSPREEEWQAWSKVGLDALNYFWCNVSAGDEVINMVAEMEFDGENMFTGRETT